MAHRILLIVVLAALVGCGRTSPAPAPPEPSDDRVRALADAYVDAYLDRFPEWPTYFSIAGRPHDRLEDRSPAALARWHAREDGWLDEVRAVDPGTIESPSMRAALAILREQLEASAATRVCRHELWNVSQMTGWHVNHGYLLTIQPVGTDEARTEALARWGSLPQYLDIDIANRERSGAPGEYNPPSEDGSRPALFYINAYQPQRKPRAEKESTAFHETIPGHHLQVAIALERTGNHPIGRYLFNSGFTEGWGLYAEELADEMKLYSAELDRLGMLGAQSWRAVRLVVDSGIHALGWTRQQAIDYMLAHAPVNVNDATSEIDRYIIMPGQATAYMLGRLEILAAREEARKAAGAAFDIRAFHDRVLEDGSVPLTYLREKIRAGGGDGGAR